MKEVITYCDSCGKRIKEGRGSNLNFKTHIWHLDYSIGEERQEFVQEGDLCENCAKKLRDFIETEMCINVRRII